jgi:hypothetical protein
LGGYKLIIERGNNLAFVDVVEQLHINGLEPAINRGTYLRNLALCYAHHLESLRAAVKQHRRCANGDQPYQQRQNLRV